MSDDKRQQQSQQLSNDDFRKLLEKKSESGNSSNSKKKNTTGKTRWIDRDYQYYQNAPEKNDPNYLDRAKERRKQGDESGGSGVKKGLDFDLLHSTKEKLNLEQQPNNQHQQTNKPHYQNESERIKQIKCKTDLGLSIINILSINSDKSSIEYKKQKQQQEKLNKEVFQKNRMLYLFDLDPVFPQLIPTTIMNSKEDCPKVKPSISGHIETNLLKKIIHFYHPDKEIQFKKQQQQSNSHNKKQDSDSEDEDIFSDNDKKDNKKDVIVIQKSSIDSDSDSDIFSDAEDYVCEVNNNNNNNNNNKKQQHQTTTTTTTTKGYFKNKEDYSDEFKPIGKEGDEDEVKIQKKETITTNTKIEEKEEVTVMMKNDNGGMDEDDEDEYVYPNTDDNYNVKGPNQEEDVYDIPRGPTQKEDGEEEYSNDNNDDEYVYPNTDDNYNNRNQVDGEDNDQQDMVPTRPMQNSEESDEEDEYVYPNTDENYEQHEKDYMLEQEKRLNEESSSSDEENDIISLDVTDEKLKRKLMESNYGDDDINFPTFGGFERERGQKINIDEMYKFKKSNKSGGNNQRQDEKRKKQKLDKDMNKINEIMKKKSKESGSKHHDLFDDPNKKKK